MSVVKVSAVQLLMFSETNYLGVELVCYGVHDCHVCEFCSLAQGIESFV